MKKYIVFLGVVLLLLCSGCGQKKESNIPQETESVIDWKANGFQIKENIEIAPKICAENYYYWEHIPSDSDSERVGHIASGTCNNKMWFFGIEVGADEMYVSGSEGEYILETYDVMSGEYGLKCFTPADLGIDDDLGYLVGMDMISEDSYMFRWAGYSMDEEDMYSQTSDVIIFSNLEGTNRFVDFKKVFLEEEIEPYSKEIMPSWPYEKCHADGKGNIWMIKYSQSGSFRFYLFDQEGQKVMEYEGDKDAAISTPIRTSDGELIIPIYNNVEKKYDFLWVDSQNRKFVSVVNRSAQTPVILQVYGLFGNDIYYRTVNPESGNGEGIVKWNIKNGVQTWLYEFKISTLSSYETMLVCDKNNNLTMRLLNRKVDMLKDWIVPLGENISIEDANISVADFTGMSEQLEVCASKASMEHPNLKYVYEDVSAEEDKARAFAELSKGEGADIMFVSMEDYYSLLDKGLLLDMNSLLSQDFYDKFLSAALDIGKKDGTLWAIPVGVIAETFAINSDITDESVITLETLISLFEEDKLKGGIRSPYIMNGYLSPIFTMQILTEYSLNNSFLIDWDKRISHFDDERFIHLLKLTATDISGNKEDGWQETDLVWGYFTFEFNLVDFFVNLEKEHMKIMGHPGYDGVGFLVPDGGVVVVNKNISDKEAVKLFLQLLFGEEIQSNANNHCLSVLKMKIEDYIKDDENGNLMFMGVERIPVYEDGTTPVHKVKEFLESCTAAPRQYYQINQIITEELDAMYKEGKDINNVAGIINKRVQLYLDETE